MGSMKGKEGGGGGGRERGDAGEFEIIYKGLEPVYL